MKILVTFAVATEFAAWRRQHEFRQRLERTFSALLRQHRRQRGAGFADRRRHGAAARAMRLALTSPADLCISSGFAGALRPDIDVGEILAARVVRRAGKGFGSGQRPRVAGSGLRRRRPPGRSVSDRRTAGRHAGGKAALVDEADAVEMESFVILAEAARHGVRAVAVRAVSDTAESSLPFDFDRAIDEQGRIRLGALIARVGSASATHSRAAAPGARLPRSGADWRYFWTSIWHC